jgi:hypothetical protein
VASDDGVDVPVTSSSLPLYSSSSSSASAVAASTSSSDTSSSSHESATGSLDFLDDAAFFSEPMLSFEMVDAMSSFPCHDG